MPMISATNLRNALSDIIDKGQKSAEPVNQSVH
jgi:hypothetical protein